MLATPAVLHICEDGTLCSEPPDRPATGKSKRANLELLYRDHAASWIFGLWRTDWVRAHFVEYTELPYWGADVLWLADICLRHQVVGDQEAVIYKRLRRSSYAPRQRASDDRVLGLDVLAREPHEHSPHRRMERAGRKFWACPGPMCIAWEFAAPICCARHGAWCGWSRWRPSRAWSWPGYASCAS